MAISVTIGALSRASGCSVDTIRYYERLCLMPPVPRSEGGHRLYKEVHSQRLGFIRRSRELGLSLTQVRDILDGVECNAVSCRKIRSMLTERAAALRREIRELQDRERTLRRMVNACGDEVTMRCRLIDTLLADQDMAPGVRCCSDSLPIHNDQRDSKNVSWDETVSREQRKGSIKSG